MLVAQAFCFYKHSPQTKKTMEINFRYRIKKKIYQSGRLEYIVERSIISSRKLWIFSILLFIPIGWFIIYGMLVWEVIDVSETLDKAETYILEQRAATELDRQKKHKKKRDKRLKSTEILNQ